MSEHPTASGQPEQPEQPDEGHGTFVGGEFGRSDNAEDEQLSTAEDIEAAQESPAHLAEPVAAPSATEEFVSQPSGSSAFDSDVEGTSVEPSPGELNEPL